MLYLHVGKPKLLKRTLFGVSQWYNWFSNWYRLPTNGTIGRASGTAALHLVQMVLPMVPLVEH